MAQAYVAHPQDTMSDQAAIHVIVADITTLECDAIVNAAQPDLLGGGGVDGAIHRAAGPRLLAACQALPPHTTGVRCPTGEARITAGFDLPARWIIHTVGPVWHGGDRQEATALAACYRHCLTLLHDHGGRSIAFPAISCGVYGYPHEAAAQIAARTITRSLRTLPGIAVTLCAHDPAMGATLQRALDAALSGA